MLTPTPTTASPIPGRTTTTTTDQPSTSPAGSPRRSPSSRYARGRRRSERRGATTVLGVVLTLSLITLTSIAIDFGHIHVAEVEMRRTADAAALAACWELFDQQAANSPAAETEYATQQTAEEAAAWNRVNHDALQLGVEDVQLGRYGVDRSWDASAEADFNAVRVTLRRQSAVNGELPLFFGALTGRAHQSLETQATAAMFQAISGFSEPPTFDANVELLPIALDLPSWLQVLENATEDRYRYVNGQVVGGSDGYCETNLYPKGTGAPGNRGTVDIGGANNSTSDLSRQIIHGISKQDFIDLGKPLEFDENGELELNGDTGISAGIKDELAAIIGQTRIIPIFTTVSGNGNNAMFTIVRFEGVRILDVKLTGKKDQKHVTIQPAKVVARGTKIDYSGQHVSRYLATPVMLVE